MRFIANNTELRNAFKHLISSYDHCCICVAWASQESGVMEILDENLSKVRKMVVGLDLCLTDCLFIENHLSIRAVRYFTAKHEGIFHPKIYLFYNDEKNWRAIIGSANLTYNGFSVNQEACSIVGDDDNDSIATFHSMIDFVDKLWDCSSKLTAEDIAYYKVKHREQIKANRTADIGFKSWLLEKVTIDDMSWDEYITKIYEEDDDNPGAVDNRIKLLERAQSLFSSVDNFNSLLYSDRACLAGYKGRFDINPDDIDCFFFGSTTRVTHFKHSIKSKGKESKAIDVIPLKGQITLSMYEDYCSFFDGNPIACVTRLLAIKRPDVFVCINNKNKEKLCNDFGITVSKLNLKNYWDLIVSRIQESKWYNDHRVLTGKERSIKLFQVAMLDCIYYEK